jgi:hypothetical protein
MELNRIELTLGISISIISGVIAFYATKHYDRWWTSRRREWLQRRILELESNLKDDQQIRDDLFTRSLVLEREVILRLHKVEFLAGLLLLIVGYRLLGPEPFEVHDARGALKLLAFVGMAFSALWTMWNTFHLGSRISRDQIGKRMGKTCRELEDYRRRSKESL